MGMMANPYVVFGYGEGGEVCWRFTKAVAPTDAVQAEEEPGFDPIFALGTAAVAEILQKLEQMNPRGPGRPATKRGGRCRS